LKLLFWQAQTRVGVGTSPYPHPLEI